MGIYKPNVDWIEDRIGRLEDPIGNPPVGGGITPPTGGGGAPGPQGPKGDQGIPGTDGKDGLPGPKGADGAKGTPGTPGAQGPRGSAGPTGATGAAGATGHQGPQGAKGDQGVAGTNGTDGINGKDGKNGTDGKDGTGVAIKGSKPTEVEIKVVVGSKAGDMWLATDTGHGWVSNGATPTVWTDVGRIQGPKGVDGVDGKDGKNGTHGANGAAGAQGPDGPQGLKGDKGDKGDQGPNGNTTGVVKTDGTVPMIAGYVPKNPLDVVTKEFVDAHTSPDVVTSKTHATEVRIAKIVKMTQLDYDALAVKENDKLYIIV